MKNAFFAVAVLSLLTIRINAQSGEELFKSNCSSCHTINGGKLVGPDLSGVYNKQDETWLKNFIRASQKMVKSGDQAAVAIFNEFKIPMPDFNFTDQQITSILDFIKQTDQGSKATAQKAKAPSDSAVADTTAKSDTTKTAAVQGGAVKDTISVADSSVSLGAGYFYGKIHFSNGATACFSCHNVNDGPVLGGGKLARDLSTAYDRLGLAGVTAIMANPPFPAMQLAVGGKLTPEEVSALNSFLKSASLSSTYVFTFPGGLIFFILAFVTAMFLVVFLVILYDDRKIPEAYYLK
ncbi:MAG TPA: cytochrome c [Bacteroidales bacterium]|nr:cytochrome c [Bacteroidales bacterium]